MRIRGLGIGGLGDWGLGIGGLGDWELGVWGLGLEDRGWGKGRRFEPMVTSPKLRYITQALFHVSFL